MSNRLLRAIATASVVVIFVFNASSVWAQKGTIEGVVIDKARNETLVGANVIIHGTTTGTITDFDGKFVLSNLQPGVYNVQVSFISYNTVIVEGIKVEANKTSVIKVDLEEVTTALEGVTVTTTRRSNTDVAMISSIKASPIVANGITAQQITRSQDRDASEVVRRVPGISIIDDRFVVVRGLNQRYNSVWINNASTPSSETDQNAFSFDNIPSAMIDNMIIAKSPSPDLPADFTGGFIKIYTKNMPEEDFFNVGYGIGHNTENNYSKFKLAVSGKTDWIGVDDGTRNLPDNFPKKLTDLSNAQLAEYGRQLNTQWEPVKTTAIPDQKLNINFGKRIQRGNRQVGTITSLNYSLSHSINEVLLNGYGTLNQGNLQENYDYLDSVNTRSAKVGLLHNWAFFLGKGNKIEFRNLFNMIGKTSTIVRNGYYGYEGRTNRSYQSKFMNRITYSGQLGGEHKFGVDDENRLDWVAGFAYSGRNEPDLKQLRTTLQDDPLFPHYNEYAASVGLTPSVSDAGRLFMKLNEYISSVGVNYDRILSFGGWKPTLKAGLYSEYKFRNFDARILGFAKNESNTESVWLPIGSIFSLEHINTSPDGFVLREMTSKSDSYYASNILAAGYVALNTSITDRVKFYGGIRTELNNLHLNSYDVYNRKVNIQSDHLDFFPSANLTYNFNEKTLIRLAGGRSVNRPEFREISPFYFYNFEEEADFVGNVKLENCYVWNFDLRYELYPNAGETFSAGIFYKKFSATIESVFKHAGNRKTYTYDNADNASSTGLEVELRKSLESISFLRDFNVVANAAYILSKVNFPEGSIFPDRAMQGQSPFLINAGIFYNNEKKGLNATIQYNIIGDRILSIGETKQIATESIPDNYEKSKHLIDLTVSKAWGRNVEVKFGVRDLLNQKYRTYQTYTNTDGSDWVVDNRVESPGTTYSLAFTVKF